MTRTEAAVRNFLDALGANSYDVGICGDLGMLPGYDRVSAELILRRLKFFGLCNSRGEHIYLRPAGEHPCTLLDDLSADALRRLHSEGFAPAAVVETSPKNFQVWLRHEEVLPRALSTLAARKLAARFGGDPGAADWRHFGRLPGFTNPKLKHRRPDGLAPFVLLRSHSGAVFQAATSFRSEIEQELVNLTTQREETRRACRDPLSPPRGRRLSHLSVARFRDLPKFSGNPAAADAAFLRRGVLFRYAGERHCGGCVQQLPVT